MSVVESRNSLVGMECEGLQNEEVDEEENEDREVLRQCC
jgi:hypothetical protein